MQYLKEDIKIKIEKAALKEFALKGFEKASMKIIAKDAGIAIGNIYRYFKNKEQLFNGIIEPVHSYISALVFNDFLEDPSNKKFDPADIVNSIMKVYLRYGTEFMIMMCKSQGTIYGDTRNDLISLVYKRLKIELMQTFTEQGLENVEQFIHVFSANLVDGLCMVLRSNVDIQEKRKIINQLLILYFNKIQERFS